MTLKQMISVMACIPAMVFSSAGFNVTVPKETASAAIERHVADNTLGSAQDLDGNVVLVSIFADDKNTKWDLDDDADCELIEDIYDYVSIAVDFITDSAKSYGKKVNFAWDWAKDEDLVYVTRFSMDFPSTVDAYGTSEYLMWDYIEDNIDTDALLTKYDADSIVYLLFLDTTDKNPVPACTRDWYEGMEYPYEICYLFAKDIYYPLNPAVVAHEILHTFGAPDLYQSDLYYGISNSYVNYIERTRLNDIMRICGDARTGTYYYDKISNKITEVTAYFIGWLDKCDTVTRWNMKKNQYMR